MQPPFAIPDKTQAHVDRLLGREVCGATVLERLAEGRFGTLYRARRGDVPVTVEVLRAGVESRDEEVRAADALKCAGVVATSGFGALPDGRRVRVLEALEGESLEHRVQAQGRLSVDETLACLDRVATVLQVTHAWAVVHGSLGPTSVWLVNGEVRLLDFGLTKKATPAVADDLAALGALGFTLLSGAEVADVAPAWSPSIPESVDRFLRELMERRHESASAVRRELEHLRAVRAPVTPPAAARRSRAVVVLGLLGVAALVGLGLWRLSPADAVDSDEAEVLLDEALAAADEQPDVVPSQKLDEASTQPQQSGPRPQVRRLPRQVPSAQALHEIITGLERRLRAQTKPGADVDQALFNLNKQRLRLTGSPTVDERKDVARQLALWRKNYLRR